jgi:predicted ATP-binding protein involved in virulence
MNSMVKNKSEIESIIKLEKQSASPQPVYFSTISLENIRCFGPEQTLDLTDGAGNPTQWTIILGNNGVGKTTLLQCLVALTPVFDTRRHQENIETDIVPKFAVGMTEWDASRHDIDKASFVLIATFSIGASLNEAKENIKRDDLAVYGDELSGVFGWHFSIDEELGHIFCLGYGASRRMGESSLSEKLEDDPFASLFSDNVELLNAEEWLLQADYAAHAGSNVTTRRRAAKRRDEIKDILINLLPDVDDIKFAQITEKQPKPGVQVKTPYGWVSIKDLSLGYKTLIAWMVDLASRMFIRYPDSPNPLAEPAVVLVDEIDLHLHPKWQRTLMSYLSERFPNTQFIATAHSPLVVQAASDANVVLLRREGDHVVIDNDVKDIHGWRVDQILTSDLFGLESARPPQLDPLLAERTKILSKSRLTKKDKARLEEIEAEIGALPTGETPEDMEAMDVIRRAAEHLKGQGF